MNAKEALKKYFGYEAFRSFQEEIIEAILNKKDVLALMPTGSGKSLCYQIPAILMEGLTIVISPLISLMKDQVDVLNSMGISATYINSSLALDELNDRMDKLLQGEYKLVYIAPERLSNSYFIHILSQLQIAQVAVDESHCISQWGHDFRPEYRMISQVIETLPKRPVVTAFTATATRNCARDIIDQLTLKNPLVKAASLDRPNLYFRVIATRSKNKELLKWIHPDESTIIYCATRKKVEEVGNILRLEGYAIGLYHGGMSAEERDLAQEEFINDRTTIMIATLAFGMGIDKPDIRKVIHYNMPKSMENYYQEAGRAGRDGLESQAILLYSPQDIVLQKFIMQDEVNREESDRKLNYMVKYCQTTKCLRNYILDYFSEVKEDPCGHCGNCDEDFQEKEITIEAQKIISCIYRMNNSYGRVMVADVLKGSKNKRIKQFGLDELSTYGIMSDQTKDEILEMIDFLEEQELVTQVYDPYPHMLINKNSMAFLKNKEPLKMKYRQQLQETTSTKHTIHDILTKEGEILYEKIRAWRKEKATAEKKAPFIIFPDQTLLSLLEIIPQSKEELLKVKGFGEKKVESYGNEILSLLEKYADKKTIYVTKHSETSLSKTTTTKSKSPSMYESLHLFNLGLTLNEIATQRNLKESTVLEHLIRLKQEGQDISLLHLVPEKDYQEIERAIRVVGVGRLKPIKNAVSHHITYDEIKIVIAHYGDPL